MSSAAGRLRRSGHAPKTGETLSRRGYAAQLLPCGV